MGDNILLPKWCIVKNPILNVAYDLKLAFAGIYELEIWKKYWTKLWQIFFGPLCTYMCVLWCLKLSGDLHFQYYLIKVMVMFCSQIGRQCRRLNAPANGKISLPCLPYYESSCHVDCTDKYYLVGPETDTCIVDEQGTMKWNNKNECRGNCF